MRIHPLLIMSMVVLAPKAFAEAELAATRGSVGEIPNSFVTPPGATADVMNNDFLGGTDKYMTGAMKAGLLRAKCEVAACDFDSSWELTLTWRALTPTQTSTGVGGRRLQKAVGRFADWMEVEYAYARAYPVGDGLKLKGQASVGLGHIGNKGMKQVHTAIHRGIGMQTSGLEYTEQPVGKTYKYDTLFGAIRSFSTTEGLVALGHARDEATTEVYLQGNFVIRSSENSKIGVEARAVRQIASFIYDELTTWRGELSVAIALWQYYQPSVKFVSDYMELDQRPQFYAELFRFNVPF